MEKALTKQREEYSFNSSLVGFVNKHLTRHQESGALIREVQSREWIAFNDAFSKNPDAAMRSTSIGLGQIMGFHYRRLGYTTVGTMWDDAKKGIDRQFWQIVKFISTDANLFVAVKNHDWNKVASLYNGAGYKALALKIGRESYDISLKKHILNIQRYER